MFLKLRAFERVQKFLQVLLRFCTRGVVWFYKQIKTVRNIFAPEIKCSPCCILFQNIHIGLPDKNLLKLFERRAVSYFLLQNISRKHIYPVFISQQSSLISIVIDLLQIKSSKPAFQQGQNPLGVAVKAFLSAV